MEKALSILKYVLLGVGVLTLLLMLFMSEDSGVGIMLTWGYILMGIALVAALLFPLFNLAQNPKGAKRSLIGLAVVVVVVGIAVALSSTTPVVDAAGNIYDKPGQLRLTDAGLYTTYFAMIAAVLAVIIGEVRNSFK